MKYVVTLIHSEEGYAIGCPTLPGCWSQGETEAEALENIADAIREYLSVKPATQAPQIFTREVDIA